jgi:hypothetical protein
MARTRGLPCARASVAATTAHARARTAAFVALRCHRVFEIDQAEGFQLLG